MTWPAQPHKAFLEPRPEARCSRSWLGSLAPNHTAVFRSKVQHTAVLQSPCGCEEECGRPAFVSPGCLSLAYLSTAWALSAWWPMSLASWGDLLRAWVIPAPLWSWSSASESHLEWLSDLWVYVTPVCPLFVSLCDVSQCYLPARCLAG